MLLSKWEYRTVIFSSVILTGSFEQGERRLARLGEDGWEAVGVAVKPGGDLIVLLKRSRQTPD